MNSQQKIINLLSICRKAGKVVLGFDAVKEAMYDGKAFCAAVASDISPKTLKEVRYVGQNCGIDVVELDIDSYDMFDIAGKQVVVMAVCDRGFAQRIRSLGIDEQLKREAAVGNITGNSGKPERTRRKRKSEKNNSGS